MRHIIKDLRMAIAVLVKSQHKEKLDDRETDIIKAIISHKKVNKTGIKLLILFVIVYTMVLFAYNFEDITASALYNIKYYDQLSDVYLQYTENADYPESDINTIFNSNNYSIYNAVEKRHLSGVVILLMIINSPVAVLVYIVLLAVIILKLFNSISLYRLKKIVIPLFLITGLIYAFAGYVLPEIVLSVLLKMQVVVMLETVIVQVVSQLLTGCICYIILNMLYKKYCKIAENIIS